MTAVRGIRRAAIHVRPLLLLLSAGAFLGCATRNRDWQPPPPPEPVSVSRELAYAHPLEEVRRAYVAVLEERGLRVEQDGAGALRATVGAGSSAGIVRVTLGPSDTLATRVSISYRYSETGNDFYHYPYRIPLLAARQLDRSLPIVSFNQAVYPPTAGACPEVPVDTTAAIEEPRPVDRPGLLALRTEYTEEARRRGVQGTVYLSGLVNASGGVDCIEVIAGLPYGLTESAIRTFRNIVFVPARQRGQPIRRRVILPIVFRLE